MTILQSILPPLSANKDNANVHAAFCVAFAGFLRMGEFTNTATDLTAILPIFGSSRIPGKLILRPL
jgi:hypothetical protein